MPLFGLLPYDDEEERRKRMLTPPINPNAPSALPSLPPPRPIPAPMPTGVPGGVNAPNLPPRPGPTRADILADEQSAYTAGTPGRLKSGLQNAARGFFSGLASGGLAGGLGGAAAGGAYGAIDPRGVRRQQFETQEKPKILERFALEDKDRAATLANEKMMREGRMDEAQLANIGSQIQSRSAGDALAGRKQDFEERRPPKTPAQRLVTFEGRTYDYNDPVQRKALEDAQGKLPRDKFGRSISRADERVSGRGGGGGGGSSQKDMRSAGVLMRQFERLKGEAIRASAEENVEMFAAKKSELDALADQIDALYGDSVEVGVGDGWPYVKFRQGGRARKAAPAAQKKQDPLGIR